MQLTDEQEAAVGAFVTGENLRLVAYAGAGKTSTLTAMARARPGDAGLYVAFNKAIADDAARKFAGTRVQCRTAHSLAYREVAAMGYPPEKMTTALTTRSGGLNLSNMAAFRGCEISPSLFGQLVLGTLRRFCQSDDTDILGVHVPSTVKPIGRDARRLVADAAADLWARQADPRDPMPLGHDGYLKVWALSNPRLDQCYAYIAVDEAQDLNPVLTGVIARQRCRLVAVGDPWQQIYEWRGARDALGVLPGRELRLTQSFRFGEAIASFAWRLLETCGETHRLRGTGSGGTVSRPDAFPEAILCRTNAGVIRELINILDLNAAVYMPGGVNGILAIVRDAERLQRGQAADSPELLGFDHWNQVVEFSETEEGAGLRAIVDLVERYGTRRLQSYLSRVSPQPVPDCTTVSTAHRAKGLEWSRVEICDDFGRTGSVPLAERRLFYVACTRARHELAIEPETAAGYLKMIGDDHGSV